MISWAIVLIVSSVVGLLVYLWRQNKISSLTAELASVRDIKSAFGGMALDALSQATKQLTELAGSSLESERGLAGKELENKKSLIDRELKNMNAELERVRELVAGLEKDRERKFGELTSQIASSNEQTSKLLQSTNKLNEALANSRARGQWGERMAEDVMRLAGLIENVNYTKQKAIEGIGSKPDFTFRLPKDLKLNMDVKFPFDNYFKYLNAASDADKESSRAAFFRDIKIKLKEVTSRDYINPTQNTVDYVLLLVPNEQVFAFIQEGDPDIFDAALKNKVICCSPITLYAVLSVIRQAVENFNLELTSNEILSLLGNFKVQWSRFVKKMETVGKRINDAQKEFQALDTTRRNELERPLNKIESLRNQKGLNVAGEAEMALPAEEGPEEEGAPEIHPKLLSD